MLTASAHIWRGRIYRLWYGIYFHKLVSMNSSVPQSYNNLKWIAYCLNYNDINSLFKIISSYSQKWDLLFLLVSIVILKILWSRMVIHLFLLLSVSVHSCTFHVRIRESSKLSFIGWSDQVFHWRNTSLKTIFFTHNFFLRVPLYPSIFFVWISWISLYFLPCSMWSTYPIFRFFLSFSWSSSRCSPSPILCLC